MGTTTNTASVAATTGDPRAEVLMRQTKPASTYIKMMDNGSFEYGVIDVNGNDRRKDKMRPIGWAGTFDSAQTMLAIAVKPCP